MESKIWLILAAAVQFAKSIRSDLSTATTIHSIQMDGEENSTIHIARRIECRNTSRTLPSLDALKKLQKHPFLKRFHKRLKTSLEIPECVGVSTTDKKKTEIQDSQLQIKNPVIGCGETGKHLPPLDVLRKKKLKLTRVKHLRISGKKNSVEFHPKQNCSTLEVAATERPKPNIKNQSQKRKCKKIKTKKHRKLAVSFSNRRRRKLPKIKNGIEEFAVISTQRRTLPPPPFSEHEEEECVEDENNEVTNTSVSENVEIISSTPSPENKTSQRSSARTRATTEMESSEEESTTTDSIESSDSDSIEKIRMLGRNVLKFRNKSISKTSQVFTTTEATSLSSALSSTTESDSPTTNVLSSGIRGRGLSAGKLNRTEAEESSSTTVPSTPNWEPSPGFADTKFSTASEVVATTDTSTFSQWNSSTTETLPSTTTVEVLSGGIKGRGLNAGMLNRTQDKEISISSTTSSTTQLDLSETSELSTASEAESTNTDSSTTPSLVSTTQPAPSSAITEILSGRINGRGFNAGKLEESSSSSTVSPITTPESTTVSETERIEKENSTTSMWISTTEAVSPTTIIEISFGGIKGRGLSAGKSNGSEVEESSSGTSVSGTTGLASTAPLESTNATESEAESTSADSSFTPSWTQSTVQIPFTEILSEGINGNSLGLGNVNETEAETSSSVSSNTIGSILAEESATSAAVPLNREKVIPNFFPQILEPVERNTDATSIPSERTSSISPVILPVVAPSNDLEISDDDQTDPYSYIYAQIKRRNRYKNRRKETELLFGPMYRDSFRKA